MRQLKPQVVEQRKRDLLQWVIHYFIRTSKPVASAVIAKEAGMSLSSATIRSILQELEEEGYLAQVHTSSGRQPTDKGYRFYVDYLMGVQKLAADEKESIEGQYKDRIAELDTLMAETSKLLSKVSKGAGVVFSPQMRKQTLRRLELIHVGGRNLLGILVTDAGLVRHWPIQLGFAPSSRQINALNRFLNDNIQGHSVQQAQAAVLSKLRDMEREFRELSELAGDLMREIGQVVAPEALYVEGAGNILDQATDVGDLHAVQSLMKMLSEKKALAGLLESDLEKGQSPLAPRVSVRIGQESGIPELAGLSLVTRIYRYHDRNVGVLGVLGSKRMEYSKMVSLVDYMSDIISQQLKIWEAEGR